MGTGEWVPTLGVSAASQRGRSWKAAGQQRRVGLVRGRASQATAQGVVCGGSWQVRARTVGMGSASETRGQQRHSVIIRVGVRLLPLRRGQLQPVTRTTIVATAALSIRVRACVGLTVRLSPSRRARLVGGCSVHPGLSPPATSARSHSLHRRWWLGACGWLAGCTHT